jgi:replicative DNA helicase
MAAHDAGRSVLVVTTEMGIEQLGRRYAALKTGVNPELLKRNMISTYMMRRIEALGAEMMTDERMRFFSVGMGAKINAIEGLMQEFDPEVVFLDGTYLVHPSVKQAMKRIERVGEVFDELKGLTISSNRPIINTMQFNRQAGKDGKDGSLENIGFTDAVGMHSSLVIGLKMGPTENPRASRTMEFLKGREGEIGQVHMNFKFAPVDMSELFVDNDDGTTPGAPGAAGDAGVDWMM